MLIKISASVTGSTEDFVIIKSMLKYHADLIKMINSNFKCCLARKKDMDYDDKLESYLFIFDILF